MVAVVVVVVAEVVVTDLRRTDMKVVGARDSFEIAEEDVAAKTLETLLVVVQEEERLGSCQHRLDLECWVVLVEWV